MSISKNSNRNSWIELFRIISMLMIIMNHYVVNSDVQSLFQTGTSNLNQYIIQILGAWGKTGINCFVLISGYFLIDKVCKPIRAFNLLIEYFFWTIVCFTLLFFYDRSIISNYDLLKGLFMPFLTTGFFAVVLYLLLLVPILNKFITSLSKKEYLYLLGILILYYTLLPSFTKNQHFDYLLWICTVYLIGGFLKIYPIKFLSKNRILIPLLFISLVVISCFIISISLFYNVDKCYWFVSDANKIGALVISILSFSFFLNLKPIKIKLINLIAGTCWGVLCIHANSEPMREFLWKRLFNNTYWFNTEYAVLHCISISVIVFSACSIVVLMYKLVIEEYVLCLFQKIIYSSLKTLKLLIYRENTKMSD